LTQYSWPVSFYLVYVYLPEVLKQKFGFTAKEVIEQNLKVSIAYLIAVTVVLWLISKKTYPLTIAKFILPIFVALILITPYTLYHATSPFTILVLQCCLSMTSMGIVAGKAIFSIYFPVYYRFTYVAIIIAVAQAVMYVFCSIGLTFLVKWFGYEALYIIVLIAIGYFYGIQHFVKLEKENHSIDYLTDTIISNKKIL